MRKRLKNFEAFEQNVNLTLNDLESYIYDDKRQVYLVAIDNEVSNYDIPEEVIHMSGKEFSNVLIKQLRYTTPLVILVDEYAFIKIPKATLDKCALVIVDEIPNEIKDKIDIVSMS